MAIAIAMTGSGLGVVILMPLIHYTIGTIGWRESYIMLGLILAIVAVIAGSLLRKDPESVEGSDSPPVEERDIVGRSVANS